jgi:hypothetical protein
MNEVDPMFRSFGKWLIILGTVGFAATAILSFTILRIQVMVRCRQFLFSLFFWECALPSPPCLQMIRKNFQA